ncbi:S8 family peptidase [Aquibacillus sp. 3ASR75-11]|uniref:S8 family peptidase n=1 Tax=Terrihalobacillus insolitus TaxID=2950438 RepID=A0A9X4AN65_9BACI|nr:S8 family peptidase [Terrihalobacillus insolitus]MDC3414679.1 S8 family peptidase [Terrihalobacillus insolitus]MDC3424208.1 S8 family peptidase [Terrihalobacillus insolitus]
MKLNRIEGQHPSLAFNTADHLKSVKKSHSYHSFNEPKKSSKNTIHMHLEDKINQSDGHHSFEVIIQLNDELKKDKQKLQKALGSAITVSHVFTHIDAIAATLTANQIIKLSQHPQVYSIEENIRIDINLDTANKWFGTEAAREDFNLTGSGVTIAIVDTGIDNDHLDLDENKVIGWKDFVNRNDSPYDDQGHGTHVASIAAGTGDANYRYKGVAPEAKLVGIKVLDANGSGSITQIIQGMEWLIDHKDQYGVQIANLSFGSSGSSDGTDALSQIVNAAVDRGIAVTVAAGNQGPEKYTIGSPGAAQKAITVGSMADVGERGFFQNDFSSRGPTEDERRKPDISGPGYRITAAQANSYNDYATYSGTSMATPFIAGTIALMLESNPSLSPEEIKNNVLESSEDWGKESKDIDYGAGRLQAYKAIMNAGNQRENLPATPNHTQINGRLQSTRDRDLYQYRVESLDYPVSLTLILDNETSDFDLYVYDSNGYLVDYSYTTERQENVSFVPKSIDDYVVEIYSYRGKGAYYLDISGG